MTNPHQQAPKSNTLSIVGIVLGCIAFLFCPLGFGIAGIVCGVIAKNQGQRLASTAIGVSVAGLVVGIGIALLLFRHVYGM